MRVVSGPVGREKIHFEAPPGEAVEKEMRLFLSWWNSDSQKIDGILRAGIAHFYFGLYRDLSGYKSSFPQ